MGIAFVDSLIRPKRIGDHIKSKTKTILYFLFLVILFVLPNIVFVFTAGGIDKTDINSIIESINSEDTIPYEIINNELVYNGIGDEKAVLTKTNSTQISVLFTSLTDNELSKAFSSALTTKTDLMSSPIILIFSKNGISLGMGISSATFSSFKNLTTYEKINCDNLNFSTISTIDTQNKLSTIFLSLVEEYKSTLIALLVPGLIIGGIINLLILIFIPTLICYIFNRGLNIKFGIIFKLAIYSFTPFVFATLISLGNSGSILAMIFEFVSLIYLFISMSSYYIQINGGHHEL